MSKKKKTTNYQFVVNQPKKRKDPKELLDKLGLSTKPEWTFSLFNFLLDGGDDDGKNN